MIKIKRAQETNCIIKLQLEIDKNQIVWLKGYDKIADYIYQNLKNGNKIFIEGKVENNIIEIDNIKNIKYKM